MNERNEISFEKVKLYTYIHNPGRLIVLPHNFASLLRAFRNDRTNKMIN